MKHLQRHPFFIRLFNWEYWSFHTVYGPIYPIWLFLCIRVRSLFFFNLGNPGLENGGFLMESKYRIYQQLPANSYPDTILVETEETQQQILDRIVSRGWTFPLLAKPDIGMRGLAVKKLESESDLLSYHADTTVRYLIQRFVNLPMEAGIFYYRYPDTEKGQISGIVLKEVLTVEGDGESSIRLLLEKKPRYRLQLPALEKEWAVKLNQVLPAGKKWILPYGNHARGALFLDASNQADQQLTDTIDQYCRQIKGFYYGRLDIRFESWEQLKLGKDFSVIELNGSGSEPTHMYDPSHSLFFAWREIVRHWIILWKISRINRKITGQNYFSFREGRELFRANSRYLKRLKASPLVK
jgi:hypothetical protein